MRIESLKIGPLEIAISRKAAVPFTTWPDPRQWWSAIRESFAGAWQRGVVGHVEDAAAHPTFWSCVTLIAGDVAKCRPMLITNEDGLKSEVTSNAFSKVLKRPNHYQNRIQFYFYWTICLLTRGNAYALKERDNRRVVTALYLLDPTRVKPMVTPSGDVYYQLNPDPLSGVEGSPVVPADDIIHDRINCLFHPLVGLSPIYASGVATMQGLTIIENATRLFKRGSNVGGVISVPGEISEDNAKSYERYWRENFSGEENVGKVAVLGGGMKFEKTPTMSSVDAQLIEQLKWGDEKVCATLHVPPYMVSVGPLPSYNNVEALGQQYYGQCLQLFFEGIELCLTEGIDTAPYEVEFDIETLERMDSVQRMEVATKGVAGGVYKPDEGRRKFSRYLKPVKGGDKVYLQRQCWPLELLGSDQLPAAPPPKPPPTEPPEDLPEEPTGDGAAAKGLDGDGLLAAAIRELEAA